MAVKKTYGPVTEDQANSALQEQKTLREKEGKELDAKREKQAAKVAKTEEVK